jgi:hypothetical protein
MNNTRHKTKKRLPQSLRKPFLVSNQLALSEGATYDAAPKTQTSSRIRSSGQRRSRHHNRRSRRRSPCCSSRDCDGTSGAGSHDGDRSTEPARSTTAARSTTVRACSSSAQACSSSARNSSERHSIANDGRTGRRLPLGCRPKSTRRRQTGGRESSLSSGKSPAGSSEIVNLGNLGSSYWQLSSAPNGGVN